MPTNQEKLFQELTLTLNKQLSNTGMYTASVHTEMVNNGTAVGVAKRFLSNPGNTYGLQKLNQIGHLEASIENLALQHQFSDMFSDQELVNAIRVLAKFGFTAQPIENSTLLGN